MSGESGTPVKHIGFKSLCDGRFHKNTILRTDLGVDRYKQLGVKERFKDEPEYRVCQRCIAVLEKTP